MRAFTKLRLFAAGAALMGLALLTPPIRALMAQQVLPPDGRPAGIACAYNTSPPTVTTGQVVWVQCDSSGHLVTSGGGGGSSNVTIVGPLAGSGSVKTLDDNSAAILAGVTGPIPAGTNVIGHVIVDSSGLPSGAATSANQTTGSAYGNAANFVKGTTAAMTGTTSTQLIAAVTSNKIYATQIICTNSHATVGTFVTVQDGSGGTTIYEGYAAAVGGGFSITLPTPISNTSGNGVYVADVTTGANVICSGSGYAAP